MRFLKYIVVLVLSLSGCNSFNTTMERQNHPDGKYDREHSIRSYLPKNGKSPRNGSSDKSSDGSKTPDDKPLCPHEKFTPLPPPPPIPFEALKKIAPDDKDALNKLLADHVDDLRKYVTAIRTQNERQRRHYEYECHKWQTTHNQ